MLNGNREIKIKKGTVYNLNFTNQDINIVRFSKTKDGKIFSGGSDYVFLNLGLIKKNYLIKNFSKAREVDETYIIYNKPIFKIIFLPLIIFKIVKYFKNEKKKVLILEGASLDFLFFFYF